MIKYLIRKALGKKSQDEIKVGEFVDKIKNDSNNFTKYILNKLNLVKEEIKIIRQKTKNLLDTNYKLGLRHIEQGNIKDAIIRFSIIIKFWPNFYEAYYHKAYLHMVEGDTLSAKETIDKLMSKNPENLDQKFQVIIEQIEASLKLQNQAQIDE